MLYMHIIIYRQWLTCGYGFTTPAQQPFGDAVLQEEQTPLQQLQVQSPVGTVSSQTGGCFKNTQH